MRGFSSFKPWPDVPEEVPGKLDEEVAQHLYGKWEGSGFRSIPLWLMDPDPGGQKHADPSDPDPHTGYERIWMRFLRLNPDLMSQRKSRANLMRKWLNTFMGNGKDPDRDPYLWLMNPDLGGPKHTDPTDPYPQHWLWEINAVFSLKFWPNVPEEVPGKLDEEVAVRRRRCRRRRCSRCRRCVGGGEHTPHHVEDLLERVQPRRLATQRDLNTERWVSILIKKYWKLGCGSGSALFSVAGSGSTS